MFCWGSGPATARDNEPPCAATANESGADYFQDQVQRSRGTCGGL